MNPVFPVISAKKAISDITGGLSLSGGDLEIAKTEGGGTELEIKGAAAAPDDRPTLSFRRQRGTLDTPAETQVGDAIGKLAYHAQTSAGDKGTAALEVIQSVAYPGTGAYFSSDFVFRTFNGTSYAERARISYLGAFTTSGNGLFNGGSLEVDAAGVGYLANLTIDNSAVSGDGGAVIALRNAGTDRWRIISRNSGTEAYALSFNAAGNNDPNSGVVRFGRTGGVHSLYERYGSGSPEGAVSAPVGAFYHRTDGGAGTSLYVKESGSGNTGWVAK